MKNTNDKNPHKKTITTSREIQDTHYAIFKQLYSAPTAKFWNKSNLKTTYPPISAQPTPNQTPKCP
ncbi:MAG: hypothetical protein FWC97_09505, partial [Treponema sp.]|nr:hypothetical protein [Treponema sp.]